MPLRLWRQAAFFERAQRDDLVYGLYYGALLALMLYNLFLFASTREGMFAYYALYLCAFFVWNFTFRGYAFQFFWPDSPTLNNQMVPLASIGIYLALALFTAKYLSTRRLAPRMHRVVQALAVLTAVPLAMSLAGYYAVTFMMLMPVGAAMVLVLLATAILLVRRGERPARFYLIAWTVLMVGAVLYYLQVFGVLPATALTSNALNIGSALEFLLLAFGVADKINLLKQEKLEAERGARDAHRDVAERLEREVDLRTRELAAANARLERMSITDPLTGLYNRREFNRVLDSELRRHQRSGDAFALCIADVDGFKLFNDTYGHLRGDEALQQVAATLRSSLTRASDSVFRIGGEEFALLLAAPTDEAAAHRAVERVRASIEALDIPNRETKAGRVTASFGVCLANSPRAVDAASLYAQADAALYAAKHGGRNCVAVRRASPAATTGTLPTGE
jgi:diguanylate cyclase